jgi:hypothetical protein
MIEQIGRFFVDAQIGAFTCARLALVRLMSSPGGRLGVGLERAE